jgi:hypothetical protein
MLAESNQNPFFEDDIQDQAPSIKNPSTLSFCLPKLILSCRKILMQIFCKAEYSVKYGCETGFKFAEIIF